jgi:hypothetical protein
MRTTRRKGGKVLKALALSFALAAVFTGTASSMARDHAASRPEIPYLSHGQGIPEGTFGEVPGGVTPANLARAYEPRFEGVAQPDGYLSRHGGDEPLIGRDGPDGLLPQAPPAEALAVSASSDGFDRDDVAIGLGLGLVLATACAAALAASRGRVRIAHS